MRTILPLILLLASLLGAAQPGFVDDYGAVRGLVRLTTGEPVAGIPVRIRAGRLDVETTTDAEGSFSLALPVGPASARLPIGAPAVFTVVARETAALVLTLSAPGVLVDAGRPDGRTSDISCEAGYRRAGETATSRCTIYNLGKGRAWFVVPADALTFIAVARRRDVLGGGHQRRVWDLPAGAFRRVAFALACPAPAALTITGPDGAPIPDVAVHATLTNDRALWSVESDEPEVSTVSETVFVRTDALGRVELGRWAPGDYAFTASAGGVQGPTIRLIAAADGALKPAVYSVPRTLPDDR